MSRTRWFSDHLHPHQHGSLCSLGQQVIQTDVDWCLWRIPWHKRSWWWENTIQTHHSSIQGDSRHHDRQKWASPQRIGEGNAQPWYTLYIPTHIFNVSSVCVIGLETTRPDMRKTQSHQNPSLIPTVIWHRRKRGRLSQCVPIYLPSAFPTSRTDCPRERRRSENTVPPCQMYLKSSMRRSWSNVKRLQ